MQYYFKKKWLSFKIGFYYNLKGKNQNKLAYIIHTYYINCFVIYDYEFTN